MARPSSFSDAPVKAPKNKQGGGKVFETRVKRGLEDLGGVTFRFTDTVNVDASGKIKRTSGAVTPPDFIHLNDGFNLLVEAKAQRYKSGPHLPGSKSISFDRLEPHQLEDLLAFDAVSDYHHGLVVVLWWNGLLGNERIYRAWAIPISYWAGRMRYSGRKSIPFDMFTTEWPEWELEWVPGKRNYFDFSTVVEHLKNGI